MPIELRILVDAPIRFIGVTDQGAHRAMLRLAEKMLERYVDLPLTDYLKAKAEVVEYVQMIHDESYQFKAVRKKA